MILFIYGLFGYVFQIIADPINRIGTCNANTRTKNDSDPPQREPSNVQLSPLGFGLGMDKLH